MYRVGTQLLFFSSFFFFHPIYYLRPSVLSLLVVTQIRGHIAGSSPPPTHYEQFVPCIFLSREDFSSSLVDSGGIYVSKYSETINTSYTIAETPVLPRV